MRQWFRGALFGFCFVDASSFCLIARMWSVDVARKWIRDDDLVMGRWSFKLPVQCSFFFTFMCSEEISPDGFGEGLLLLLVWWWLFCVLILDFLCCSPIALYIVVMIVSSNNR